MESKQGSSWPRQNEPWIVAIDGTALVYRRRGGGYMMPLVTLNPFHMEELIPVMRLTKPAEIEIKDQKGHMVQPFVFTGRDVALGPQFFGRGWSLFIDGLERVTLSQEYWEGFLTPDDMEKPIH